MHLMADGRVFNSAPSTVSRALDTSGTGAWSVIANHSLDLYRDYGSSVMYSPGRILVAGGSDPPTETAEVIDLNAAEPRLAPGRLDGVPSPAPQCGGPSGRQGPGHRRNQRARFQQCRGPGIRRRNVEPGHRNLDDDGERPDSAPVSLQHRPASRRKTAQPREATTSTQAEIYEPPYLFAGSRPAITSAPSSAGHGQSFFVQTPDAASIAQVTLLSLSSVTHSYDMNQRFNRLSFSPGGGGLNVVAPTASLAPPGPYMLFILNSNGVPSVARIVNLTASSGTTPTLSSLSPADAAVGGPAFTLTVNGSNFVSGSVVRWNGAARPTTFVSSTRLTASIPASDIASGGEAPITVTNPGGGASNAVTFGINAMTVSPATIARGRHGHRHVERAGHAFGHGLDCLVRPGHAEYRVPAVDVRQLLQDSRQSTSERLVSLYRAELIARRRIRAQTAFERHVHARLTSNVFTVSTGVTLSASPARNPDRRHRHGHLERDSAALSNRLDWTSYSWRPDRRPLEWMYVSCSKTPGSPRPSGSCPFTVPNTLAPGNYQLRLFANGDLVPLAGSNSFTVGASPGAGTLQFSAATYSVAENGGSATITITRTGGSTGAVGVTVSTSNGTATAGSDYTAVSTTVSFAAGDTANKTVSIPITDDALVEGNETVNVALSTPTGGATLGSPNTAVLTITDNDGAAAGSLQFSAATYSVAENGGSATITVTRTGGSAGAVGVTVTTSNGTATAGSDYTAVSQTVSFATGDTANKTVSIPITDDALVEGNETVNVALSTPTGRRHARQPEHRGAHHHRQRRGCRRAASSSAPRPTAWPKTAAARRSRSRAPAAARARWGSPSPPAMARRPRDPTTRR